MEHHATSGDLARMINEGFTSVTNEISEVKQERRLTELEARMKKKLEDALAVKDKIGKDLRPPARPGLCSLFSPVPPPRL